MRVPVCAAQDITRAHQHLHSHDAFPFGAMLQLEHTELALDRVLATLTFEPADAVPAALDALTETDISVLERAMRQLHGAGVVLNLRQAHTRPTWLVLRGAVTMFGEVPIMLAPDADALTAYAQDDENVFASLLRGVPVASADETTYESDSDRSFQDD